MRKPFILTARLEGISFLLILFITMPLKYYFEMPMPNKVIGMVHGLLFVVYFAFCFVIYSDENWSKKKLIYALIASSVPFGTFIFEKKYLK